MPAIRCHAIIERRASVTVHGTVHARYWSPKPGERNRNRKAMSPHCSNRRRFVMSGRAAAARSAIHLATGSYIGSEIRLKPHSPVAPPYPSMLFAIKRGSWAR